MDTRRTISVGLAAAVLAVGGVGCGGDDEASDTDTTPTEETTTDGTTTDGTTTDGTTSPVGRQLFIDNCGTCHALSDAGTTGTIGPSLDGASLAAEGVEAQVRSGAGLMPPFEGVLSNEEIREVAAYVAAASQG